MTSLVAFEAKRTSQNGEDGVIAELVRRIGAHGRWFVEFGIEDGSEGNCVELADNGGWNGLFIEADPVQFDRLRAKYADVPRVRTTHATVLPDTIEGLLDAAGVPPEPDVFSIDIDGNDFYVWRALERYRPRIVIVEYNADLPLDRRLVTPFDPGFRWDGTAYFGASLGAFEGLGTAKGYQLVHTDRCGINAFFVREDLVSSVLGEGESVPRHRANYFHTGHGHPADPHNRPWVDLDAGGKETRLKRGDPLAVLRTYARSLFGRHAR